MGTKDLISLGIGSCVGTGMYLVSGLVAKKIAGPGVVISYLIAGFAALLSGNCLLHGSLKPNIVSFCIHCDTKVRALEINYNCFSN